MSFWTELPDLNNNLCQKCKVGQWLLETKKQAAQAIAEPGLIGLGTAEK